ncbi:MAG: hypothetical protein NTX67_03625, partial [Burkholderiales bacterium]|nr:hypothetical protein [Burkholderiales bacterium]
MTVNNAPTFTPPPPGAGMVIVPVGLSSDSVSATTLLADGKILMAGQSSNGSRSDFSLIRLNANGSLDTSFSGDGKVIIRVGATDDSVSDMTLQADGKILVAGTISNPSKAFGVIRLNTNGSLDNSFDSDGMAMFFDLDGANNGRAITLQADGKIILAGYREDYFRNIDFCLIRLNANGSLDTSFDGDGKAIIPVGVRTRFDYVSDMSLQADGKILVLGTSYNSNTTDSEFSLIRLNTNGSLDTSFDGDGKAFISVGTSWDLASTIKLQTDGKILVTGNSFVSSVESRFSMIRLNTDGSLDTSFDTDGKVIGMSGESGSTITLQSDGKILVLTSGSVNPSFGLIRLNANGSRDTSFDGDGKAIVSVGTTWFAPTNINLQADGKILVAGSSHNGGNTDFNLIRLNANGSQDTSFSLTPASYTLGGTVDYNENSSAITLDSTAAISDPELTTLNNYQGNYNGASVTLVRSTGANAQDVFSASGNLYFAGNVAVSSGLGINIGNVSQSSGTLTITFNSNATQALVNEALSSLTYANSSDTPPASVQINWTFSDGNSGVQGTGGALTATGSTTVNIYSVNDAPTGSVTISGTATQGQTLTASNTLADADGLGTVSYQWKAGGVNISGATGSTYMLTQSDVGKAITVVASYTDSRNTAESVTSSATSSVANVNDAPTGSVTISRTATQGQTLTASNTLADADGLGIRNYQWKAGGVNISGATGSTYTLTQSEVGKAITVAANYTDGGNTAESVTSSATSSVANVNDAPTGSVTISGTAAQGQTLTASNTLADADGLETISYQWKAGGVNISGATGSTYMLTQSDVGKVITVVASYTDGGNTAESVTSSATSSVANVNDAPTGSVTISGTATLGQTLIASNTLTDADGLGTVSYQWKAGGVNISGATSSTYTLTQSEVGKTIKVVASYTDGGNTAESVTSSATSSVANVNDAPTGGVTISGTAAQGQTLTAINTLADVDGIPDSGAGVISYQWNADGVGIFGAKGLNYTLTQGQVGKVISVTANYTDSLGTAETVTSSTTSPVAGVIGRVNGAPTGSVTISGTATQGQTLTASNTLADADGLGTVSYQWKAGGVNISGATGSTYTLTQSAVGKAITVVVSYTDSGNTAESVTSSATSSVGNVNDAPTGSVTISGTALQGQTLTAANNLADADGLGAISYQWKADGVNISGATSSTLTLAQAQVGKTVTVAASYTDGGNTAESVVSIATASVQALATGSNLTGQIYQWKSHTLLSGAEISLAGLVNPVLVNNATPLYEFKNVELNSATGVVQMGLWMNLSASIKNFDLNLKNEEGQALG